MTLDLSYTTIGRERERNARIINGMEKKKKKIKRRKKIPVIYMNLEKNTFYFSFFSFPDPPSRFFPILYKYRMDTVYVFDSFFFAPGTRSKTTCPYYRWTTWKTFFYCFFFFLGPP